MTEKKENLSQYDEVIIENSEEINIGIIVSEWNPEVTNALKNAAVETLIKHKVLIENIDIEYVPGSFELPLAAQWMLEHYEIDAIICLGSIIKGETPHFDYVCQGVTNSIARLNQLYSRPVIFGVLTTNDMQQALERAGGKHGNKGVEAAVAALKMIALSRKISGIKE